MEVFLEKREKTLKIILHYFRFVVVPSDNSRSFTIFP